MTDHQFARVHELKTWPEYWRVINAGVKTVEIRRDDRGFRVGDVLVLREWVPDQVSGDVNSVGYTGNVCRRQVTHVLRGDQFGLTVGFVALSLASALAGLHGGRCPRCRHLLDGQIVGAALMRPDRIM